MPQRCTKKDFQTYLNDAVYDPDHDHLGDWLRKNQPDAFNQRFNEYCQSTKSLKNF